MTPDSSPPPDSALVRLLVRRLEHVHLVEGRTGTSTVFCPGQCRSMEIETCRVCPQITSITDEEIVCTPVPAAVSGERAPVAAPAGSDAFVGDAMGYAALTVDAAVPAARVAPPPETSGRFVAVVVDDEEQSLGLLIFTDAPERQGVSVEELARSVAPVREAAPLAHAIDRMVRERARALPVVNDVGQVVGLLTDLDALHWVARREPRR